MDRIILGNRGNNANSFAEKYERPRKCERIFLECLGCELALRQP